MQKFLITLLFFCSTMLSQTWQHFDTSNSSLPGNVINSIIFGGDGVVWIATDNGLASYNSDTWKTYSTTDGLSSNLVHDLLFLTGENNLWLGTDSGSTDFMVNGDQIASNPEYYNKATNNILSNNILALGIDNRSNIWLGTDAGISILLQSGIRNITVGAPNIGDGLKSNIISGFAVDAEGQINVATKNGGISRFNVDEVDAVSSASIVEETWSALPSDSIFAIHIGSDNVSWFGTEKGIVTFLGGDSKAQSNWLAYYHTGNGLIDNRVTSITEDNAGNIWVGTKGGVSYFNGIEWNSFTTDNGLVSNNISTIAIDADNNIWIGSDSGLMELSDFTVDTEGNNSLPEKYDLDISVYPNPFNPSTNINYTIQESGKITISIFDLTGQKVKTLVNEFTSKGEHQKKWNGLSDNGEQMPSGVYFVLLNSKSSTATQKIVLLR